MNSRDSRRVVPHNREISSGGLECEGHNQDNSTPSNGQQAPNVPSNGQQSPNVPSNGSQSSVVPSSSENNGLESPAVHSKQVFNGTESVNAHNNGSQVLDVYSNGVENGSKSHIVPSNGAHYTSQSPNHPSNSVKYKPGSIHAHSNGVSNESKSLNVLSHVLNKGSKSAVATSDDWSSSPKSNATNIGVVHCGFHATLEGSIVLHVHNGAGNYSPQHEMDAKSQSLNVPIESQSITLSCESPTESRVINSDGDKIFYIQTQNSNSSDNN